MCAVSEGPLLHQETYLCFQNIYALNNIKCFLFVWRGGREQVCFFFYQRSRNMKPSRLVVVYLVLSNTKQEHVLFVLDVEFYD